LNLIQILNRQIVCNLRRKFDFDEFDDEVLHRIESQSSANVLVVELERKVFKPPNIVFEHQFDDSLLLLYK
jgi:hypothetical protein